MKKVLFVLNTNIVGGAERVLVDYLRDNNEIEAFVYTNRDRYISGIFDGIVDKEHLYTSSNVVYPMKLRENFFRMFIYFFKMLMCICNIKKIVKRESIDVIYGNNSIDLVPLIVYKMLNSKTNIIFHIHDMLDETYLSGKFLKRYNKYVDKVIVPSIATKKYIKKLLKEETVVEVVYNSINKDDKLIDFNLDFLPKNILNKELKVIGFVGMISERKNPLLFVDIISKIYNERKDFCVLMAGKVIDGEIYDLILKKINKENLPIYVLGELKKSEIDVLYKYLDIMILTSERDPLPTVILEAMNNDVVVLARDVDGVSEMIKDEKNGYLFSVENDVDEIVDKLNKILDLNKKDKEAIFYNGRKIIEEKFSQRVKQDKVNDLIYKWG